MINQLRRKYMYTNLCAELQVKAAFERMYSIKSIQVVFLCIVVILMLEGSVQIADGAPENATVEFFPGYSGSLRSKIYSGYVTISEAHGRDIFYYFVESERNPIKDPVLLWLSGGPGCSSFTGFAYEIGPMYFDLNYTGGLPKLIDNPHSWTKVSNIIFVDSPSGTGFSYSKTTEDYIYGDFKIVSEVYSFVIKWFEAYPEFLSNALYIGGDSYSGIAVPMLTQKIADGIKLGVKPTLNVKGYMVGNGATDDTFDCAQVPFAHRMGLISDESYKAAKEACNGKYSFPISDVCLSKLLPIVQALLGIKHSNILDPLCFPDSMKQNSVSFQTHTSKREEKLEVFDQLHEVKTNRCWPLLYQDGYLPIPHQIGYQYNPCPSLDLFKLSVIWAKNPYVRRTIHAKSENMTGVWTLCTSRIEYKSDVPSVVKYHRNLTMRGLRALIYSGDHDLYIPFVGTQAWIRSLGYSIVDEWRSWFVDGQVAGYTRTYDNHLTFATVKGAGHTAPEDKPRQTFMMFERWSSGEPL